MPEEYTEYEKGAAVYLPGKHQALSVERFFKRR